MTTFVSALPLLWVQITYKDGRHGRRQPVSDEDDPAGTIATIRDALAPGSYLVISHIVPGRIKDREVPKEVADRLLDGFGLIKPDTMAPYAQSWRRGWCR